MSTKPSQPALADGGGDVPGARQLRVVLIAVSMALMAVIASVSGLTVAQTQLAVDFDTSQDTVLWIINIYTLTLAALLLPLGAIGDRLGRKPTLIAGLAVFGIASIAAGLAPTAEIMMAARVACGIGAATIMPITLAVITSTFPEEQRGKAIGVWTGVAGGGGILGMFLSALLVDVADWRWMFVLPVALIVVALAMTLKSVPNSHERPAHAFDAVGALVSIIAVAALTFVLQEGPRRGWTAPATLISLAAGLIATAGFVSWELRRRDASLLDVRLFGQRGLAGGSITLLVVFGVQSGIFVVLFPFFQAVLGWSALLSAAALMPMAAAMMTASGLAPRLAARVGSRLTMSSGIALTGVGLALLALFVSIDGGYLTILPGIVVMGVGMALSMVPSTEAITRALPQDKQGVASALNDVTREFGTALGVAMLGAILTAGYRNAIDDKLDGIPQGAADTAREGIANALQASNGAGSQAQTLVDAAKQSYVDGWQQSMWAGVALMGLLLVYITVRGPKNTTSAAASDKAEAAEPASPASPFPAHDPDREAAIASGRVAVGGDRGHSGGGSHRADDLTSR
ncbi:MFS transporter [Actinomadura nitritigenes]|uniref:MFS transporter n=1 Tax=Actinomadura nitritigenes TaxID=134602 RepID=UPI0036C8C5F2